MNPLISTQDLAARLAAPGAGTALRIYDATVHLRPAQPGPFTVESGRADYEAGHIPGAAFLDLQRDLSVPASGLLRTLPPVAHLEAALSASGLSRSDDCVIYSSTHPMWATRLWWMLKALGLPARVLDGGLPKWKAEGRPLATGVYRYPPAHFSALPRPALWADKAEVLRSIGNGAVCTLNALTASAHAGTAASHYGRKGHIKGSVNLPYPSLLAEDGTLKTCDALRAGVEATGALGSARAICYCGGGIAATLTALVLELLGHADVAVYDGSLSEWVQDPEAPMETGG